MPSLFGKLFGGKQRRLEKALSNIDQNTDPASLWKTVGDLGEGTFGTVHKVKHVETGEFAAAKVIPIESEEDLLDYAVEADILLECPHEHVVGLRGAYLWKSKLWIVMELCEGGALDDALIELERGLEEEQIKAVACQVLVALVHLHRSAVIHRDVKAGNLLLDRHGNIKLTDFGVSSHRKKTSDTFIGTPYWMAPEVIICENVRDRPYNNKADIWSLGITLLELAETSPPFHAMHPMRVLFKIPKSPPPTLNEPHLWSAEFSEFLASCLKKDPQDRPSAEDLLKHPFVQNAEGLRPLRDLFRLIKADVVETIADLDAAATEQLTQTNIREMEQIAKQAKEPSAPRPVRPAPPPPAGPVAQRRADDDEEDDTSDEGSDHAGSRAQRKQAAGGKAPAIEVSETATEAAATHTTATPDSALLSPASDDKKFKTLTKTRTFVNEEGKEVTVTTQRIVQTSRPHGYTMKGKAGPHSKYQDWEESDAQKIALLRKHQLREMRQLRREEGKETSELVDRLKVERETNATRQEKEMQGVQRVYERTISQHDKKASTELDKLEKAQATALASKHKKLKNEHIKQRKKLKQESADARKRAIQRTKSLPRKERRASKQQAEEDAVSRAEGQARTLEDTQRQQQERELKMLRAQQRAELLRTRLALMQKEQNILRERADKIADLGHQHLLETHQMLRHQLHATFLLQKHQVHFRHEKELEQMQVYHHKRLESLDKRYEDDLKLLPKRHKVERAQRKKELKRRLSKSAPSDAGAQMAEFKSNEERKYNMMKSQLEEAYQDARQSLLRQMEIEMDELREQQQLKKQTIITNEAKKFRELDEKHADEMREFKSQVAASRAQLDSECTAERRRIESTSGSRSLLESEAPPQTPTGGDQ